VENKTLHLLILEDNPDDAELAVKELKREGFTVKWKRVETEKAFRKALAEKPDLIFVDYSLPSNDGMAVLQIRQETMPEIPLIMVSGTTSENVAVECMKSGATDFVFKGDLSRLGIIVKRALKEAEIYREHRQALEALSESERDLGIRTRIADIFLSVPEDKMYGEVLQVVLEVMESKYGIFGYIDEAGSFVCPSMTRDVWEQCQIPDKDIVFPRETWSGIWGKALIEKKTLYSNESFQVPEGHIPILNVLCVPIIFKSEVIGNFVVGNKMTSYDENDKQLLETIAEFTAPVIKARLQKNKEIEEKEKLRAQLQQAQKMEVIGTLAAGIAHDFNNRLTTIIGYAQIALLDVIKDESLRIKIEEIKKAGERAASLTRQLLAFSRKHVIKPEVLDLNEVISETEKMLKRMIGEDVEFQTVLESELWKVHIDSGQIDQMIINMAVNSRDAMPQGGKLIVETANVDLDENYFRELSLDETPGSYVMLAISDTGSGMNKETREHIFEPFFTTKELGKGTGLGLSTVFGIAKQNNGFIWVYSIPGQGTTFKIYLPKVKEDTEPEEKKRTPVDDLNGSETVFIVEDDDKLRNLTRKILERYGYSVLEAENGKDALRFSEEYEGQIDLMLTDVVMPKMSGKELAERLKSSRPEIKVIYMSGYTGNAIVHHGVLPPWLNFLEKPFTPEGLARKVREVLDRGIED